MPLTRRAVQRALGVLWLVDGGLQLQPYMFGPRFAREVLAPAAAGQPSWVAAPVTLLAHVTALHATTLNTAFAAVQIAIGVGLLSARTARAALAASIAWSLAVWWLGEGFGGLASGHASLINGAPGAVVLYAVLAAAAWPGSDDRARTAAWLPKAWALLWIGGAVLQTLPGQNRAGDVAALLSGNADDAPGWLSTTERTAGRLVDHAGPALIVGLVLVMVLIGGLALSVRMSPIAAALGSAVALVFWVVGQNLGDLLTGQATDPNTAPLIILLAASIAGRARAAQPDRAAQPQLTSPAADTRTSRLDLAYPGGTP